MTKHIELSAHRIGHDQLVKALEAGIEQEQQILIRRWKHEGENSYAVITFKDPKVRVNTKLGIRLAIGKIVLFSEYSEWESIARIYNREYYQMDNQFTGANVTIEDCEN
tara:strand:+ start:198 stop:524 length:327 start_codon:yes stop_codon:yes gene_type:complete